MAKRTLQKFLTELRRRHVPQTAAVYAVAAWAAIQFADVVAPNLNWPQSVGTARRDIRIIAKRRSRP